MSGDNECYEASVHPFDDIGMKKNSITELYASSTCEEKVICLSEPIIDKEFGFLLDINAFRHEALPKISGFSDMDCSTSESSHNSADSTQSILGQIENQENHDLKKDVIELSPETNNERFINNNSESESVKHLNVTCLESIQKLKKTCENQSLKFIGRSADSDLTVVLADDQKLGIYLRECSVNCLQSIKDLSKTCKKLGLVLNEMSNNSLYEVDMIVGNKVERGEKKYLIKWQNYNMDTCTWEPESNLVGCKELIEYYEAIRKCHPKLTSKMLNFFVHEITTRKPYDILILKKVYALMSGSPEALVSKLHLNIKSLKVKAKELLKISHHQLHKITKTLLNIMLLHESRKTVLVKIKEWQIKINSCNPAAFIEVQNDVDLETPPTDFQFIHDYVSSGIDICKEPIAFCQCDNCFESRHSCCPKDSDGYFAYDKNGRLALPPGYPIFECNKLCKCPMTCINRVVQHGQKVKVAIFRTSNGCGWGLKTLEAIHKGQFVLEYLGEIITSEAAEARGKIYDHVGRSYLFDLDYGVEHCTYTVDAGPVGNAAHFINHSCSPNLHVFAVWINQPDPNLPRLAFFARKNIRRGEELTFDYKMLKNRGAQSSVRVLCKCNSKHCKKYLC